MHHAWVLGYNLFFFFITCFSSLGYIFPSLALNCGRDIFLFGYNLLIVNTMITYLVKDVKSISELTKTGYTRDYSKIQNICTFLVCRT